MKLFRFLLQNAYGLVILAIFVGILNGASSTGLLSLTSYVLNVKTEEKYLYIWLFGFLCIAAAVFRIISEIIFIRIGQNSVYNLRLRLSNQILSLPLTKIEELGAARLTVSLTDDIFMITNATTLVPILFINLSLVVGCLIYLMWLSLSVFIAVFGFIILGILAYQLPIMLATKRFAKARDTEDQMYDHFRSLIEGIKELKMDGLKRQVFLEEILEKTAKEFLKLNTSGLTIYSYASSFGQLLVFILVGLILFALPQMIATSNLILVSYTLVILYIMTPLQAILNSIPNLLRANIAVEKLESIGFEMENFLEDKASSAKPKELKEAKLNCIDKLELIDAQYAYKSELSDEVFQVGPVNLSFDKGELVFFTGGNGSGKTTLAKLLVGLYLPQKGKLKLNNIVIDEHNRNHYQQNFTTIFSDFFLFDRVLGIDEQIVNERVDSLLEKLDLNEKVKLVENKFSTIKLSQGQRKRLSMLIAYLEDKPIYLFDEWAADQDPHFRKIFYKEILQDLKAQGKTVFVITHDDHYFHVADRIIKLNYGRIESDERHD